MGLNRNLGNLTEVLTESSGNVLLNPNNVVGGTNVYIGQTMASNDWWRIYGNTPVLDQGEMVFELGDNAIPHASNGQRFRFFYNNASGEAAKNPFILDYNTAIFNTDVGIGTDTPIGKLNVLGSGTTSISISNSTPGTNASPQLTQLNFLGFAQENRARIEAIDVASNTNGSQLRFYNANSSNVLEERMRIFSNGNVFIGSSASDAGFRLNVETGGRVALIKQTAVSLSNGFYALDIDNLAHGSNMTTAGAFRISTNGNSGAFVVNGIGNVGIGTTSPSSILEIREGNRTNGSNITNFGVYTTTAQSTDVGGTIGLGGLFNGSQIAPFGSIRGGKENSTSGNYAGYLSFQTIANNSSLGERMRIASNGDIGIGTNNPINYSGFTTVTVASNVNSGVLALRNASNFGLNLYGSNDGGLIEARDPSKSLLFVTNDTLRMRIYPSGNVFIGPSPSDAGFRLDVNGTGRFSGALVGTNAAFNQAGTTSLYLSNTLVSAGNSSGTTGLYMGDSGSGVNILTREKQTNNTARTYIYTEHGYNAQNVGAYFFNTVAYQGNNSSAWGTVSDIRIKENVRPINNSLNKILSLKPCHFEYKTNLGKTKTGFIAQEFEQVLPGHVIDSPVGIEHKEFIPEDNAIIKSIDADLIPYLVAAIQELKAEIEILKQNK
jgi:hypothetical protein